MKYRCRTTKPKASEWFDIEAESPELAANSFHSDYDALIDSVTYTPNPELPGAFVYFAVVEVEGHGTWVSRVFLSRILRRGGAQRKPPPTIKHVALLLGYKHNPRTLLEDGWGKNLKRIPSGTLDDS